MKFSLGKMLLLPAAWAWALAFLIAPFSRIGESRETFRHDVAETEIREISEWLAAQRPNHSEVDYFLAQASLGRNLDPWGNLYEFIDYKQPPRSETAWANCVYSNGEDGESLTGGNDKDDVNSWDYDRSKHYGHVIKNQQTAANLLRSIWLTPVVFLGMVLIARAIPIRSESRNGE